MKPSAKESVTVQATTVNRSRYRMTIKSRNLHTVDEEIKDSNDTSFYKVDLRDIVESTRNNAITEGELVGEKEHDAPSQPPVATRSSCKYKLKLEKISRIINSTVFSKKKNNDVQLLKQGNLEEFRTWQRFLDLAVAELKTLYENYHICLKMGNNSQFENEEFSESQRKRDEAMEGTIINKSKQAIALRAEKSVLQPITTICLSVSNSSGEQTTSLVNDYEEKLAKYRRYIELLNLEHQQQLHQHQLALKENLMQMEAFFNLREEDIHFEHDLKQKELALEHKQALSQVEREWNEKMNQKVNTCWQQMAAQQRKHNDIVQAYKEELNYREKHMAVVAGKYKVLLELKDRFLQNCE